MKLKTLLAAAFLMLAAPLAFAGKTVIFNPQAAILGTEAAKARDAELKADKDFAALVAKIENLRAEMMSLQKDAEKNGMTWSADQQAEHKKKMTYLSEDFQLAQKKAQAEQNAAVMKLMQEAEAKLEPILKAYMEEKDIDLILHAQAAVIAKPVADITMDITDRLNKAK
ncbi:OmpH family outer membrane protein [Marinagarivorans cellulosilyticus]|uniref:Outer membrane protein n=1 Tax=Marinagarivorans cellulosilyticus TaxID=2721545 RepID=A0AAN2BK04_9GAMM|nr:OmpH family outer membrane protein [Marinagarivorans cellulosilyticus]BCD97501.1 outer membrane protein [Marinagarivorans cellulosilyticus]